MPGPHSKQNHVVVIVDDAGDHMRPRRFITCESTDSTYVLRGHAFHAPVLNSNFRSDGVPLVSVAAASHKLRSRAPAQLFALPGGNRSSSESSDENHELYLSPD